MPRKSAIFASAFVIGLSGAMMPGPLLTAGIGYTLSRGFVAGGPLLVLGHAILELALVILVVSGLGPVLSRRKVGAVIGVIGGAVLGWMGYGMLAFALSGEASLTLDGGGLPLPASPVVAGILISLANPYWSLWWATIGLKYVSLSHQAGRSGLATFFCGHILADIAWYLFVAGCVAAGRSALSNRAYAWIIGACAVVLLGFAILFLVKGVLALRRKSVEETSHASGHVS